MMWEQILIGVIVILAAWYIIRHMRRVISGQGACQEDLCPGCACRGTCKQAPPQTSENEETGND